jgi:hypothetical protein
MAISTLYLPPSEAPTPNILDLLPPVCSLMMGDFSIFETLKSPHFLFTLSTNYPFETWTILELFLHSLQKSMQLSCEFSHLENLQGPKFLCVLQWTYYFPPGSLSPYFLILQGKLTTP